ncbi:MAG: M24 family metallopeptidase [Thermoproteota archaeon]
MSNLEILKRLSLDQKESNGFLILDAANLLYFTGFPAGAGLLVSQASEPILFVYHLNYLQAEIEVEDFHLHSLKRGGKFMERIADRVKTLGIQRLAVDTLTWQNYRKLTQNLSGNTEIELKDEVIWKLRKVKDEEEFNLMRKAAQLTSKGMEAGCKAIKPGIREYEVAAEIEYAMRKKGSEGTAFQTIVASGPRSAFPHGGCTDRKIREGDLVVVDIGAIYQHYRSDMTRTVCAGEPSKKQKEIYKIVKQAQEEAFQALKPNAEAQEVDQAARKVIQEAGYGDYFVHGLGHGVGLEIHEPPTLNSESKDQLKAGNVVTIEPGIYLEEFGGIRIEDTVLVRSDEPEKLTQGPYTLKS